LQAARSVFHIYIVVSNNGHLALYDRDDGRLANQVLIALIIRMYAHGGISQNGLGTRSSNGNKFITILYLIAHVLKLGLLFAVNDFLIRERGLGFRIPVDHPLAAVDVSALMEFDKAIDDGLVELVFQGKARALPVAGGAQLTQLLQDDAAVLVGPFPGML